MVDPDPRKDGSKERDPAIQTEKPLSHSAKGRMWDKESRLDEYQVC